MLAALMCLSLIGCKKKTEGKEEEEKSFNVYVDVKDKNSLSIIKYITEEYKKKNPKSKLKINDVLGGGSNISEDISKGSEADIIFTSRGTMVELAQKGLLSDMAQHYEKNKIGEKNYNIISAYGRVGDKYYGIGMLPYTIEIFYNDNALTKLGAVSPTNIKDMMGVAKKLVQENIRIPVIVTEDLNINETISAMLASNRVDLTKLDEAYGSMTKYKELKEIQGIFDEVNSLVKSSGISKNSFEIGNESTLSSLINGTTPVVIATSYYYGKLKEAPVSIVEDYTTTPSHKSTVPIIVDAILCTPSNAKNSEEAGKFIKFMLSEDMQEQLAKKDYITGNKKANAEITGLGEKIAKHLSESSDNSIVYTYSLPKKFKGSISARIDAILSGKYSGSEWQDIVNEIYK
jgi:ABC-type glycerol-3-phosphate transport system substrate-binding protein